MDIFVETSSWAATTGLLKIGPYAFPCTLGGGGVTHDKTEGDKKTPLGRFSLRQLFFRADRLPAPDTGLPLIPLTQNTGWCEDPAHPDYNRCIALPHPAATDHMTRDDALYDLVVIVGYNDDPPIPGKGSAIFIHLARPEFTPTAGCIGLKYDDFLLVLKFCTPETAINILPPPEDDS